jgi:polysaccharide pyruvyl transferase WcaK-like protein
MLEQALENLPWILAALLGMSEALAHIPALESNSVLQLITKFLRKAKEIMTKMAPKAMEDKSEEQKEQEESKE